MDADSIACCICLDTNTAHIETIRKWNCSHKFHAECISNWNHSCPVCRNCINMLPISYACEEIRWTISRNPRCVLNTDDMKRLHETVPDEHVHIYKNAWKDQDCIAQNHRMVYLQPYGVIAICEDCDTIQTYCLMHRRL
jgi:hypothetical protein